MKPDLEFEVWLEPLHTLQAAFRMLWDAEEFAAERNAKEHYITQRFVVVERVPHNPVLEWLQRAWNWITK